MALDTDIERPAVLNQGVLICAAVGVVGFIASFFTTRMTQNYLTAQGMPADVVAASGSGMTVVMAVVGLALNLLCLYFIAKGKNVARIIWLVLVVLGLISVLLAMGLFFKISVMLGLFALVSQLANLVGTVMMWLPASSDWFKEMKAV